MAIPLTARRAFKPAVFLLALVPFALLLRDFVMDGLGPDPIEEVTHRTGFWGLTFIVVALAVTPLRRLSGWNGVIKTRRMLGLFGFFYITLHFLTYLVLDQFFAWSFIIEDIAERPYITVGFTSWVLLIPLAVTSTSGMIRRLGKRWRKLHSLVYVVALGGVVHFMWQVKADLRWPHVYAWILIVLLALRLVPAPWFQALRGRR
jgi:sulfoxide reductase heme-binding subunit YedZ